MQADYVVVGAGSAGCVLASRLSEDGSRVVLLEAGPKDWHPMIHVPAGVLKLLYNPRVNWNYTTDPEPGIARSAAALAARARARRLELDQRHALDPRQSGRLRRLVADGLQGLVVRRGDAALQVDRALCTGRGRAARQERPILVEDYRTTLDLTHRFVDAAQQAGLPLTKDLNGRQHEGVGYSQMSRNGRLRGSTARTFLAQARGRPNLRVETKAFATKLLFEGKRCVGVAFRQNGPGPQGDGRARGHPVGRHHQLAAPAAGVRHWLRLRTCKSIGVDVVHDLPGVGANLSDHYAIRISHRVKDAVSINELSRGCGLPARSRAG